MSSPQNNVNIKGFLDNYKLSDVAQNAKNKTRQTAGQVAVSGTKSLGAPLEFGATIEDNQISLSWQHVLYATSYKLERALDSSFDNSPVTVYSGKGTSFVDTGLVAGTHYWYRVVAVADGYNSTYSQLDATTLFALGNVSSFAISNVYDTALLLTWQKNLNASTYIVEQSTLSNFSSGVVQIYSGSALSKAVTGLAVSTQYYFRVHPVAAGYNIVSYATANTTTAAALAAPASLVPSNIAATTLTVTWAAVSGAQGYILERATASDFSTGLTTRYNGTALTFNDTGLTTATNYWYRVHAIKTGFTTINYTTLHQITS